MRAPVARRSASAAGDDSRKRLVIVGFFHQWSPPSLAAARMLDSLRISGHTSFARVLLIDADAHFQECFDLK